MVTTPVTPGAAQTHKPIPRQLEHTCRCHTISPWLQTRTAQYSLRVKKHHMEQRSNTPPTPAAAASPKSGGQSNAFIHSFMQHSMEATHVCAVHHRTCPPAPKRRNSAAPLSIAAALIKIALTYISIQFYGSLDSSINSLVLL